MLTLLWLFDLLPFLFLCVCSFCNVIVWWKFGFWIRCSFSRIAFCVCMCVSMYCCRRVCRTPTRKALTAIILSAVFDSAGNIAVKHLFLGERVIVRVVFGSHPKVPQEILEIKLSHKERCSFLTSFLAVQARSKNRVRLFVLAAFSVYLFYLLC